MIVQGFWLDNGVKYIDQELQAWLSNIRVRWEFIVLYNPQQNGVLVHANSTFKEKLWSIIIDSNVSKCLWLLGFLWSIPLKNRLPTRAIPNITPFQAVTREIPDLVYLRIFGCRAYILIPKKKRLKVQNGIFKLNVEFLLDMMEVGYIVYGIGIESYAPKI